MPIGYADGLTRRLSDLDGAVLHEIDEWMAGLSKKARHELRRKRRRFIADVGEPMLERRDELPPERQKVGESTVQLAGHYLAKVLDLEAYLLHQHFMKYNLRFYWPAGASEGSRFEDYGHVAIRPFSNVPSYQVNRNTLEIRLETEVRLRGGGSNGLAERERESRR